MTRIGFYAGSFDPITRGHMDIVVQALTVFDKVIVAVGRNGSKGGLFSPAARVGMIADVCAEMFTEEMRERIDLHLFHGSMAAAARETGATHLVRAFRQVSDFNDEFGIHGAMEKIAPDLPMVYLICRSEYLHVSSSMARELARVCEDMSWIVHPVVQQRLMDAMTGAPG